MRDHHYKRSLITKDHPSGRTLIKGASPFIGGWTITRDHSSQLMTYHRENALQPSYGGIHHRRSNNHKEDYSQQGSSITRGSPIIGDSPITGIAIIVAVPIGYFPPWHLSKVARVFQTVCHVHYLSHTEFPRAKQRVCGSLWLCPVYKQCWYRAQGATRSLNWMFVVF